MIINDQGSIVMITPESDLEYDWLTDNTNAESWQWLGSSLAIDYRFADNLIEGIQDAGFIVEDG